MRLPLALFIVLVGLVCLSRKTDSNKSKPLGLTGTYTGTRSSSDGQDTTSVRIIYRVKISETDHHRLIMSVSEETQLRKRKEEPFETVAAQRRVLNGGAITGVDRFSFLEVRPSNWDEGQEKTKIEIDGRLSGETLKLNVKYDFVEQSHFDHFSLLLTKVR
ncbi:hypothetical protein [Dyadobacter aurulentus]|uniref:hypothetical protein n=1 Tax=Dyadobacter sp. UC 10 TaxID=2605428 RepID=UPI0011F30FD6|nr:hypothetical protein [Dyadobacter sp. UC 10]KAA0992049.1 hypothetical protein FXO21_18655 [Dyadobacter sp. UC 10]